MAAGQGFKTFATGDVLSASDVNGYLMQGVLVFADATERNAEITSPQEGQFAYLKDTNVTTYYTGSAWANLDTTGMTNPMTTTGDMVYSSSGSTPARLGIGSTGQVLTVAGGVPSWATPASGSSFQGARAVKTANQSLSNATSTALTFEAESFDAGGYFTTGSNTRMTIPTGKGGYYVVIAQVGYANGTSNTSREAWLRVNGSDVRVQSYTVGMSMSRPQMVYAIDILSLNAADYVEVIGYQDTGGSLNVINDGNDMSYFSIYYLGA